MQKIGIFSLFLLLSLPTFGTDEPVNVPSEIEAVTVFLSGAQVTRKAKVALTPGTTNLRFDDLARRQEIANDTA